MPVAHNGWRCRNGPLGLPLQFKAIAFSLNPICTQTLSAGLTGSTTRSPRFAARVSAEMQENISVGDHLTARARDRRKDPLISPLSAVHFP